MISNETRENIGNGTLKINNESQSKTKKANI